MFNPNLFVPGLRIKVMARSSAKSRMITQLVGYKPKRYLALEPPVVNGVHVRMEKGTEWTVSFINEGTVYSFASWVLGASAHPFHLLFLSYPKEVEQAGLREGKRFPVNIQTLCAPFHQGPEESFQPSQGIIRDISDGGCQLATTREFKPGQRIDLTLALPDQEPLKKLPAEVMSSRELGEGKYLLGLSFTAGLASDEYKRLKSFLANLSALPLRI